MKSIELIVPNIDEYEYKCRLESDLKTMSYNAGYDVAYEGYHYNTGCIDFNKEKWLINYNDKNRYFAYIKDCQKNTFVGYVNYQYNAEHNIYECGILIEYKYRNMGYAKDALRLLIRKSYENGIEYLYDSFEQTRENALKLFLNMGFNIYKETVWKKFNKEVKGINLRIDTKTIIPNINSIKNIYDLLEFLKDNIRYGYVDINNNIHISNLKNFRKLYRTLSVEETLKYGVGTCIEQVSLMHYILDKLNIKNKMFATRIYEPNDFNDLDAEEHMHCFILCYINNVVYHIEHPNTYKIGIYEYVDEASAINEINNYYIDLSGGIARPITEFYEVKPNLSFQEFNNYINDLDKEKTNANNRI